MFTSLDGEQFLPVAVPGFSRYFVSNLGRVASLHGEPKILNPQPCGEYLYVYLCNNRRHKRITLHKLVALTFLGRCPKGKEVNHINCNKHDCRAVNLEYATHRTNMNHARTLRPWGRSESIPLTILPDIAAARQQGVTWRVIASNYNRHPLTMQAFYGRNRYRLETCEKLAA